jgi:hypothetical protein
VGEPQERHRRHGPGGKVVAGRDVDADAPPEGQAHHEEKDDEKKHAGEVAGDEIKAVEEGSDHAVRCEKSTMKRGRV